MKLRTLLIFILTIALPISQAYAVVPEVPLLSDITENANWQDINLGGSDAIGGSDVLFFEGITTQPDLNQAFTIISNGPFSNQNVNEAEEINNGEIESPAFINIGDHHFWTKGKIIIVGSVLLSTGLLLSLILLLASGFGSGSSSGLESGSGGGSGSGGSSPSDFFDLSSGSSGTGSGSGSDPSSGNGNGDPNPSNSSNNSPNNNLDNGGLGNDNGIIPFGFGVPIGDSGVNPDTGTLPKGSLPTVPHNPEPSTFLLMGLGLLVPFFRKRFAQ